LLAPVGTWETFWAAVEHGADAVYLGLKQFNARALARNFTLEEIAFMKDELHAKGRRLFVAFNSLIKEKELKEAIFALAGLEEIGVDGIILQDLGLWRIARDHFPSLRLHASTLMTIHNSLGVAQAEAMGFKRVVLAREMTMEEITQVARNSNIELEVFIHGAMCFTVSGRCLFSSFFGGMSSTRGKCVQPCRRRYQWGRDKGGFFSMADLCGVDAVAGLKEAGIASLKIEGRLRPAHYVASVVTAYRMVLDGESGDESLRREAQELLASALGRRLSSGFFFSDRGAGAVSPSGATNTGEYLGKVISSSEGALLATLIRQVAQGDRLRIATQDGSQMSAVCGAVEERGDHTLLKIETSMGALVSGQMAGASLFRFDRSDSHLVDIKWKGRRGKRISEVSSSGCGPRALRS